MPKSYADLLREARAQIREVTPAGGRRPPRGRRDDRRRPRGVRVGAGPPARRPATSPSRYIEQQIEGAAPDRDAPVILYCAGGVRSLFAAQTLAEMGYTDVASMSRRLPGLEGRRARLRDAGRPDRRAEAALQPPPAHPRGRLGGPGQAPRLEGAAHRRRRPRLAGRALPRRRGRRHDRDRRLRRRRRQQPPAPDRPHDRPGRRAQGRVGAKQSINALNPDDQRRRPRGDARRRQRRADHRRLRRHPRRDRHVRDALHPQRRGGRGRHPGRPRQRLPVRGPADHVRPVRGAVLSLPVPDPAAARARARLLGGRRARRRARDPRPAPGQRGAQGPARDRQHAGRPAAPVRCPRDRVHRAQAAARPELPGLLRRGRRRRAPRAGRCRSTASASTRRSC